MEAQPYSVLLFSRGGGGVSLTSFIPISGGSILLCSTFFRGGGGSVLLRSYLLVEAQSYFVLLFSRGGGLTLFIPISGDLTLFYFFQGGGGVSLTSFIPISGGSILLCSTFFRGGGQSYFVHTY